MRNEYREQFESMMDLSQIHSRKIKDLERSVAQMTELEKTFTKMNENHKAFTTKVLVENDHTRDKIKKMVGDCQEHTDDALLQIKKLFAQTADGKVALNERVDGIEKYFTEVHTHIGKAVATSKQCVTECEESLRSSIELKS